MKTIQMTIDEPLLTEVDRVAKLNDKTRSAFIREALEEALHRFQIAQLEAQDRAGYARQPQTTDTVGEWQAEQVWEDEWNEAK